MFLDLKLSTGGEVANAQVCKTCIRGFNSRPVLQFSLRVLQFSQSAAILREGAAMLSRGSNSPA